MLPAAAAAGGTIKNWEICFSLNFSQFKNFHLVAKLTYKNTKNFG